MRKHLIAAAFAVFALPAAAQAQPYDPRDEELVRGLPSPGEAQAIGRVMSNVMGALMNVPIGPLVQAIDPYRRAPHGETLGDLASRDDPYYAERLDRTMEGVTAGMGQMAGQAAVLAPVLRRSLDDISRSIESAARGIPGGGYDHDWDD